MLLRFNLDHQPFVQKLNALSSLSHFLSRVKKDGFSLNPSSSKLVILNNEIVSSRHIPLVALNEGILLTIEGIRNTREYKSIIATLEEEQAILCHNCIDSRILLFYYLLKYPPSKVEEDLLKFYHSESCYCLSFSYFKEMFYKSLKNWESEQ